MTVNLKTFWMESAKDGFIPEPDARIHFERLALAEELSVNVEPVAYIDVYNGLYNGTPLDENSGGINESVVALTKALINNDRTVIMINSANFQGQADVKKALPLEAVGFIDKLKIINEFSYRTKDKPKAELTVTTQTREDNPLLYAANISIFHPQCLTINTAVS